MNNLSFLDINNTKFPSPNKALTDPNGLLAIGGDLHPKRLVMAYYQGIFPWFNLEDPILWWSPNPRAVFYPNKFHISKSLKKFIKKSHFKITINHDFASVINGCAEQRDKQDGTWITEDIYHAYLQLHQMGYAHSIEVWSQDRLVGGLYGLAIGKVFCGESMFHRATNASKVALVGLNQHLVNWDFQLLDAQIMNPHLESLGAENIKRHSFLTKLHQFRDENVPSLCWQPQEVSIEF